MKKEIIHNSYERISKFQFLLFTFIFFFLIIKMDFNSTIYELRSEKIELNKIIIRLNSLNKDYLNLCNLSIEEKQKLSTLNLYFNYLENNNLTQNKEILEDIEKFFQYILTKDGKSQTLICPNENNVTIQELLTFSTHLRSYVNFTNMIQKSQKSLFEEIRDTSSLNGFVYFTKEEKQKIFGGEDIFVAITGNFGENLQKANEPEIDFENELKKQAENLYYTFNDYTQITLSQLNKLNTNYDNYINKVLENKMIGKDTIPFTELSIDKNIFSIVFLIVIIVLLLLIILETIKLNKMDNKVLKYINIFNVFILLPKKEKENYSMKGLIFLWSFIFIAIPILFLFLIFSKMQKSFLEISLITIMILLYYSWIYLIYKSFKNK